MKLLKDTTSEPVMSTPPFLYSWNSNIQNPMNSKLFHRLREQLALVSDLHTAEEVLFWDQETYMPPGGHTARALQRATLSRLAHRFFLDERVGQWLEALAPEAQQYPYESFEASLIRVTQRDYEHARKLPEAFISTFQETVARAEFAWEQAKKAQDFSLFAPLLKELVHLNRQKAELIGYRDHPYDALLKEFEPDVTTRELKELFAELRACLVPLVAHLRTRPRPPSKFLHTYYSPEKQEAFGREVIREIGYDFTRGRLDFSAHPFSIAFSTGDVRITTRINPHYFPTGFFATLHECGHALYDQGIDPSLERTPLGQGASTATHESQSRFWEMQIGHSLAFWERYYPRLQHTFPEALGQVPLEDFYRAIHRVEPTLIRVEADEITYNLHILLRFELELALIEGHLEVEELPEVWNERMERYIGIRPQNDAEGVLQDIHWSQGNMGYFPCYTLGNLMAAQLLEQMEKEIPSLYTHVREGRFQPLLTWLREHIHRHGRIFTMQELLLRTTGETLHARSWLRYIQRKYTALYGDFPRHVHETVFNFHR